MSDQIAAGLVREVKLAGQTFRIRPLDVASADEMLRWAQDRYVEIARRVVKDLPAAERLELLTAALQAAALMTLASDAYLKVTASVEGLTRLLWYQMRDEHPDLDQVKILALLIDEQTVLTVFEEVRKINEEAAELQRARHKTIGV